MKSAYLGKICVHFLDILFLKYNENALFLFKNVHSIEKEPILFEK